MPVNGGLQCTRGIQHRKAICVEENGRITINELSNWGGGRVGQGYGV